LLENGNKRSGLEEYCKVYQSLIEDYLWTGSQIQPEYKLSNAIFKEQAGQAGISGNI
jgi:hypothetical protein